jgi:type IV pilus assembly protein PilO
MAVNLEMIEKMPLVQKAIILAVTIAVLGVLFWYFIYRGLANDVADMNKKVQDNNTEIKQLADIQQQKEYLQANIDEINKRIKKYREELPTATEMEQLLVQINDLGTKNGVQIKTLTPKNETAKENYVEVPIDLSFTGSFRYAMKFFYDVTHLDRIVNFGNVSMGVDKSATTADVTVNCTAYTYKFAESK